MKKGDSLLENTLLVSGRSWIWIHFKNIRLMKTGIFFFFCLSCVLWTLLHLEKCLAHSRCFTNACLQNLCPQLLTPWFPPWFLFLSLGALRFLLLSACPVVAPSSSLEPHFRKFPAFWILFLAFSPPTLLPYPFTSATSGNLHLELGVFSITQDFPAHQKYKEIGIFLLAHVYLSWGVCIWGVGVLYNGKLEFKWLKNKLFINNPTFKKQIVS